MPLIDQYILSICEFFLIDSSFTIYIHCLEVFPELVVETEIYQSPFECSSWYQTLSEGVLTLHLQKGRLISPHNHWFSIKNFWEVKNISESFVNFCKRKPVISIDIETSEDLLPCGDGLSTRISWNFLCSFLDRYFWFSTLFCSHFKCIRIRFHKVNLNLKNATDLLTP